MLAAEREVQILAIVRQQGAASVRNLADRLGVTEATIRRDLSRLESSRLLRRTHGGAIALDKVAALAPPSVDAGRDDPPDVDALIIAPVQNREAHTLRERAVRNRIPLIAESSPQKDAIYLGPDNFNATFELGRWAGLYAERHLKAVAVLDVSHSLLSNTRDRSAGFIAGLKSVLGEAQPILTVNGRGMYNDAYQVAQDALRLHPEINVIFGINDDAVLAGIQAYTDLGHDPEQLIAINVGGEGRTIFDVLHQGGPLKACLALFPEIVGRLAVELALRLWAGQDIVNPVITPHALITTDTLTTYYTHSAEGWTLRPDQLDNLLPEIWKQPPPQIPNKRLAFIIHYRTHEWYQNLAAAMISRASEFGVQVTIQDVVEDLKAEIRDLRRLIGKLAASYVKDGETIILDTGTTTTSMAQFLRGHKNLTVITNSAAVFQQLRSETSIRIILTGGEFHRESQSFVGRGAQLLLSEVRADKVFIVAGGVSGSFGVSSVNAEEAEVRRSMIEAAREVIVMADHTVLDVDSKVRVIGLEAVDTVITDTGVLASQRLELTQRGIKVIVAGQVGPA